VRATDERVLDVRVIHRTTRTPLSDVVLKMLINAEERGHEHSWTGSTDAEGSCKIKLPEIQIATLRLYPSKEGFVPLFILLRSSLEPLERPKPLLVAMEPGTTIGGIVQNETGEPIEGVMVGVHYQTADPAAVDNVHVDILLHTDAAHVQTGKEGRWQFNMMPAEIDRDELRLFLSHPDYLSDTLVPGYVPMPITPQPPMGRLRDRTAVMVMKKGSGVTGRVMDTNGLPIGGASVAQGSDRFGGGYPSTQTDGEGRFQFGHAPPGEMILTVQAAGYSPDLRQIVVGKGGQPVEFRLERGHTLKGRVLDKAGNPVAGAFVAADTWRGRRSLKWRVDTDAQGRFQWDDAPADEVQIDMGKHGFMSVRNHRMTAADKEYVITMPPALRIHGRVVDKATAKPVAGFTLVQGLDWGDGQPLYWDRRNTKTFTEGRYEVTYSEWRTGMVVRIEAPGYMPEVSRPIRPEEGDVALDFALTRGTGPSGTVVFPGGEPATGVTVLLATPSQSVYISDGRRQKDQDNVFVETGADGRFSFPAQTDPYVLVFLHEKGYAEVLGDDLAAS